MSVPLRQEDSIIGGKLLQLVIQYCVANNIGGVDTVVLTNAGTKAAMDEMQYGEMF